MALRPSILPAFLTCKTSGLTRRSACSAERPGPQALNVSFTNNAAGTEGRALVTGVAVTCETLGALERRRGERRRVAD